MRRPALPDAAAGLSLILFVCAMGLAFGLPANLDDARYAISHLRGGADGWGALNAVPYCTASFFVAYPALLVPGRFLAWVAAGPLQDFMLMRAQALAVLLLWAGYVCWLLKRRLMPGWSWLWCAGAVAALCSVGMVPLVLLQLRPEVGMLLVVTLFATLPVALGGCILAGVAQCVLALAMVLAGSWFFSAQVTALLFVPLLLAGACYAPMARGLKLGVVLVLLLMAGQAAGHWQARLQCPEDARGAPAAQLLTPAQLIHRVNQNFDHYLESHRDLERILFTAAHGISKPQVPADTFLAYCGILLAAAVFYVIPLMLQLLVALGFNIINAFVYVQRMMIGGQGGRLSLAEGVPGQLANFMIAVLVLLASVQLLRALRWQMRSSGWQQWRQPEQVLLFALAGSWLLQAGVQNAKGLHDVALMWPCFGLICALAAAQPLWREAAAKYHRRALLGLVAVAAASQGALLSGYVPLLRAAYAQADEYGALDNGGLLLRPTGHAQVAEGIRATALLCGIGNSAESRHVLLDPLAYFAMQDTAQPLLLSQSQPDRKKLFGLLQARGSDGAVLRCPLLPPEVRAMAIEEDGMCCLTREAIAWVEP